MSQQLAFSIDQIKSTLRKEAVSRREEKAAMEGDQQSSEISEAMQGATSNISQMEAAHQSFDMDRIAQLLDL